MKQLILILFTIIALSINAQTTLKPVSKAQTESSLIKTAKPTGQSYKGMPVFKSSNNKLFVVKKSKNGSFYKIYLKES